MHWTGDTRNAPADLRPPLEAQDFQTVTTKHLRNFGYARGPNSSGPTNRGKS